MRTPAQTVLLGAEVSIPEPRRPEATNDLELIEAVLALAVETGYMLGPADQVARKVDRKVIRLVPGPEAAAVRQLIHSGQLSVGGHHSVELTGVTVSARSVLVPPATRNRVARWRSYKPLR